MIEPKIDFMAYIWFFERSYEEKRYLILRWQLTFIDAWIVSESVRQLFLLIQHISDSTHLSFRDTSQSYTSVFEFRTTLNSGAWFDEEE